MSVPDPPATPVPLGRDPAPPPHVCDVRDPTGDRTGYCHLAGPHGGPCPTCHQHADDCAHQAGWETQLRCAARDCEVHR